MANLCNLCYLLKRFHCHQTHVALPSPFCRHVPSVTPWYIFPFSWITCPFNYRQCKSCIFTLSLPTPQRFNQSFQKKQVMCTSNLVHSSQCSQCGLHYDGKTKCCFGWATALQSTSLLSTVWHRASCCLSLQFSIPLSLWLLDLCLNASSINSNLLIGHIAAFWALEWILQNQVPVICFVISLSVVHLWNWFSLFTAYPHGHPVLL